MGFDLDLSHSNIQDFGISLGTSFAIRNIFRGAETLEISAKNTLGSSSDIASISNEGNSLFYLPFAKFYLLNLKNLQQMRLK